MVCYTKPAVSRFSTALKINTLSHLARGVTPNSTCFISYADSKARYTLSVFTDREHQCSRYRAEVFN